MTELGQGVAPDGTRVVSAENLAETWQPAVRVTKTLSYGMGWFIETYRGVRILWHDGDVLGFKALIAFIPDANVGLVVLTNRMISTGFSYSIRYQLVDQLYGLDFEEESIFAENWDKFKEAVAKIRAELNPLVDPVEVAPYVGNYEGNWRVELRDGNALYALRGPYEWRLLRSTEPGDYIINNGFGLATPLKFIQDETGVTMTFTLTSGEIGTYHRTD
jgi:CubicO group peptidase (beta-lactamase class C family)